MRAAWRELGGVADAEPAGGGCGARQRRLPVGGAAYGSPRKAYPPETAKPRTRPLLMVTTGPAAEPAAPVPALAAVPAAATVSAASTVQQAAAR